MRAKLITKILLNKNAKTTRDEREKQKKNVGKMIAIDNSQSNWIISWTNARKSIKAK